jgi:hypothetical protein
MEIAHKIFGVKAAMEEEREEDCLFVLPLGHAEKEMAH